MEQDSIRIAHITKQRLSLPFVWDRNRIIAIKTAIQNKEPLQLDDRFYYDRIANDIMSVIKKRNQTTTAAFLIVQLPLLHMDIVNEYIEAVLRDKNPLGAYFAIRLKEAVKTEEQAIDSSDHYDDLISIILQYGDVPLWIESLRHLPNMPLEEMIVKVGMKSSEDISLWNREIGTQAKSAYEDILRSLETPVDPRHQEPIFQEIQEDENDQSRLHKMKSGLSRPINAIKNLKNAKEQSYE